MLSKYGAFYSRQALLVALKKALRVQAHNALSLADPDDGVGHGCYEQITSEVEALHRDSEIADVDFLQLKIDAQQHCRVDLAKRMYDAALGDLAALQAMLSKHK